VSNRLTTTTSGRHWKLERLPQGVTVPLSEHGTVVRNNGSLEKWRLVKLVDPISVVRVYS